MKQRRYKHLSLSDRLTIERMLLQKKFSKQDIADAIGCSIRTIYYEIKRATYEHTNSDLSTEQRYCPEEAERKYRDNLAKKGRQPALAEASEFKNYVSFMIKEYKYSPKAVLYTVLDSELEFDVRIKSVNTIYQGIRRGYFDGITMAALPRKGKYKAGKKQKIKVMKQAAPGVSIEKRPEEVLARDGFGDWEMDSVVGRISNRKTLLVLTERKTRFEIIEVMRSHTTKEVVRALNRIEKRYGSDFFRVFRSITVDNGCEFKDFAGMEKALYRKGKRTEVYFCHPYSSYERGSNENNNMLIRRFYPKGSDFDKLIKRPDVKALEEWMNFYPRQLLGGRCSFDLFTEELGKAGCKITLL